jgi:hypothetical protein
LSFSKSKKSTEKLFIEIEKIADNKMQKIHKTMENNSGAAFSLDGDHIITKEDANFGKEYWQKCFP